MTDVFVEKDNVNDETVMVLTIYAENNMGYWFFGSGIDKIQYEPIMIIIIPRNVDKL